MLKQNITHPVSQYRPRPKPRGLLSFLLGVDCHYRNRRQMTRLDAHLRRDAGLDDRGVEAELTRPVWDIPAWWK